jgi:hypothetical protein
MANANVASMSVDALLKLREDIEKVLTRKVRDLKDQLARLGHEVGPRTRVSSLKGRSVPVKYRDKSGNTWQAEDYGHCFRYVAQKRTHYHRGNAIHPDVPCAPPELSFPTVIFLSACHGRGSLGSATCMV